MLLKASPQDRSIEIVLLCIVRLLWLIFAAYGELGNQSAHSAHYSEVLSENFKKCLLSPCLHHNQQLISNTTYIYNITCIPTLTHATQSTASRH